EFAAVFELVAAVRRNAAEQIVGGRIVRTTTGVHDAATGEAQGPNATRVDRAQPSSQFGDHDRIRGAIKNLSDLGAVVGGHDGAGDHAVLLRDAGCGGLVGSAHVLVIVVFVAAGHAVVAAGPAAGRIEDGAGGRIVVGRLIVRIGGTKED